MNPYQLGATNQGSLWDGFASAAGAVAQVVSAFRPQNNSQLPATQTRPVSQTGPLGIPVLGWIIGGAALLLGAVLLLRK